MLSATLSAQEQRVLMLLQSSGQPAAETFASGVESRFRSEPEVETFTELYDTYRFSGDEHEATLAEFLRSKYAGTPIDLLIAAGPDSLAFLQRWGAELFPSVPTVFGAIRELNPVLESPLSPGMTGIISSFDVAHTLELAIALQPDATRVVFVSGVAPFDAAWRELAGEQVLRFGDGLESTHLTNAPLTQILEELGRLPPDTIVVFLTMMQDGGGNTFVRMDDMSAQIAAASSAPVYGVYEPYIGRGAVGGYVDRFEALGAATASLALRVLTEDVAAEIPPQRIDGDFIVDSRQLRRWGLDASRLPEETIVRFGTLSIWDQYRGAILGVLALIALQTLLIVALGLRARKRRLELALHESEERYRNVVENQTDLICRYLPDTTLTFVNEAYCRYFGRAREELVGTRFIDLVPEKDRPTALANVQSLLEHPGTVTYDHQVVKPDGGMAWQQWIDHTIPDEHGETIEIQGIGRDITQQKTAEQEARQNREQVMHLTRVAILGELSGALAHELNQPLTAILANAQAGKQLLARTDIDIVDINEILDDIVADDVRAGEVITRLRALFKRGGTDMQLVDVNGLVREVLSLTRSQLVERQVAVAEQLGTGLPNVLGDPVQLQQVLLNLLMNACEAMGENAPVDRILTIRTAGRHEGTLAVSVIDRGAGLGADAEERLFEPFFTTKENGLGLGLAICRSIVSAHGGQLSARNNAGGGATVEFTLPGRLTAAELTQTRSLARIATLPHDAA